MDGFEFNKIAGAVLFALLVLFGAKTLGEIIFTVHAPEKPGYMVEVPDEAQAKKETPAADVVPLPVLLAKGDAGSGQKVAKKCAACHTFDSGGANKIGPNLHGIVGKALASVDGFAYSAALKGKGGNWGYQELDGFLASPKGFAPGTKMSFAGVKKPQQRADLILYLRDLGGNPPPLPEAVAEKPAQMTPEAKAAPEKAAEKPAQMTPDAKAAPEKAAEEPTQKAPQAETEAEKPATTQ